VCLKRAKDLCNAPSDLSEEEKQVYVLTQLGKMDEAEELATKIPFGE
jgi:signal recognition particle subunit SRP72